MKTGIVGLHFGDEGKGKIVDILSQQHDCVVRYNGGANAGHTIVVDGKTFKFHHLPSGVVSNKKAILTSGMVINPIKIIQELDQLDFIPDMLISHKAHCVMPWHIAADVKKGGKIGTTKRGIGPCYADKMHRWNAIRMGDLLNKLKDEKFERFFMSNEELNGPGLWEKYHAAAEKLQLFIGDTGDYLRKAVSQNQNILFESANGIHLDIDHGTFPFVTSSAVGPAGIPQSCELPNLHLDRIIGIMKCYMTRVGEGPFPSELVKPHDPQGCYCRPENRPCNYCISNTIRKHGKEYGTTTGRARRIGWLDLDLTKHSIELTGATEIALMHVDTLMKSCETIQVKWHNKYIAIKCWDNMLDSSLIGFKDFVEQCLEIPISMTSFGPDRIDTESKPVPPRNPLDL